MEGDRNAVEVIWWAICIRHQRSHLETSSPRLITQTLICAILMKSDVSTMVSWQTFKSSFSVLILNIDYGVISLHIDLHLIAHPLCQWDCNGSQGSAAVCWRGEIWLHRSFLWEQLILTCKDHLSQIKAVYQTVILKSFLCCFQPHDRSHTPT